MTPQNPRAELLQPSYKLVSYTQPSEYARDELGIETPLELVAFCARVSNPKNQLNHATAAKLIRSLIKRKEWSPLEMVDATFAITTARDISRQAIRHKSFTPQEFSQRYAEVEANRHCLREARYEHPTDRQSSIQCDNAEDIAWWIESQLALIDHVQAIYQEARRRKFAKEVARVVLPEGLTLTDYFFKGSIRSWIHYLELRTYAGTQKEHRELALGIAQAIAAVFPIESVTPEAVQ